MPKGTFYNSDYDLKYFGNNSFSGTDMVATMHISNVDGVNGLYTLGSLQTLSYSTSMKRMPIRSIGNINAKDYVMGARTIAGSLVFAVFDRHFAYEAMKEIKKNTGQNHHFLADELPPFNITISFANEYGKMAKLAIYGVRLVNEGQVMSINDIFTENTYQYVATDIDYLSDENDLDNSSTDTEVVSMAEEGSLNSDLYMPSVSDSRAINPQMVIAKAENGVLTYGDQPNIYGKVVFHLKNKVESGEVLLKDSNGELIKSFEVDENTQFPVTYTPLTEGLYHLSFLRNEQETQSTSIYVYMIEEKETRINSPKVISMENVGGDSYLYINSTDDRGGTIQVSYSDETWLDLCKSDEIEYAQIKEKSGQLRLKSSEGVSPSIAFSESKNKNREYSDLESFIKKNTKLFSSISALEYVLSLIRQEHMNTPKAFLLSAEKVKKDLENSSDENKKVIAELISSVTTFDSGFIRSISDSVSLPSPVVLDSIRGIVGIEGTEIDKLIIKSPNGKVSAISKDAMKKTKDGLKYQISNSLPGVYEIYSVRGNNSSLKTLFYSQSDADKNMLLNKNEKYKIIENDIINKNNVFSGDSLSRGVLVARAFSSNENKYGALSPEVIEHNATTVSVRINAFLNQEMYLCFSKASEVLSPSLKIKIPVKTNDIATITKNKHSLVLGEMYALWLEDKDENKISEAAFHVHGSEWISQETKDIMSVRVEQVLKQLSVDENKTTTLDIMNGGTTSSSAMYNYIKEGIKKNTNIYTANENLYDLLKVMHSECFNLSSDKLRIIYNKQEGSIELNKDVDKAVYLAITNDGFLPYEFSNEDFNSICLPDEHDLYFLYFIKNGASYYDTCLIDVKNHSVHTNKNSPLEVRF